MDLKKFLDKMRKIENNLLDAINDEENKFNDNYFNKKENFLANPNDQKDFRSFISLIGNISTNHHRSPTFIDRIEKILLLFKDDLVNKLTSKEICETFVHNKVIFLFLIKNDIFKMDNFNIKLIKKYIKDTKYFEPEITKKKYDPESLSDEYIDNREKGENESQLCQIIRSDSIDDFIIYVNRTNLSLNSTIKTSEFETNQLLLTRPPTLIEYASFFGSIQIVNYLFFNKATITGSIWKYSIHSNNDELIYFLLRKQIQPDDQTYEEVFLESIKCFHNQIAHYIEDNLLKDKDDNSEEEDDDKDNSDDDEDDDKDSSDDDEDEEDYRVHIYNSYRTNKLEKVSFKYNNYEFYPERISIWSILFLNAKNESELADLYLESQNINKYFIFNDDDYEKVNKNCMKNKQTGEIYDVDLAESSINNIHIVLFDEAIRLKDFPSILEIKGFGFTEEDRMPFFLYDHLKIDYLVNLYKKELTGTQRYILILGITIAMKFLHDNNIILHNLSPLIILIDNNLYPLINITRFFYINDINLFHDPKLLFFSSPESFCSGKATFAGNVYTYSLIVYMIITGTFPFNFQHIRSNFGIFRRVEAGLRPSTDNIHSDTIREFLYLCWHSDPQKRLSFDQILDEITREEFYSYFRSFDKELVKKYLDAFTQEDFKKLKDYF